MNKIPIIILLSDQESVLEGVLRERYAGGYRVVVAYGGDALVEYHDEGEEIALVLYEYSTPTAIGGEFLAQGHKLYPSAPRLSISDAETTDDILLADHHFTRPYDPPERHFYPLIDELLAEWRASVEMPFTLVKGIMTLRAVWIRESDTLHRAAEIIALSGVSDLMVVDSDNNFVGVLSVGDVLRAAMPDSDEITASGGTLDQAFRLFLRKGSELMYKPIQPLIIRTPMVVDPDDHVAKVAALMLDHNIHRLPVVKDGRLVGTVGRADICQAVVGTL